MSFFSSSLSSSSNKPARRASASPAVVTNILNNMYAHQPPSRVYTGSSSGPLDNWQDGSQRGDMRLRRTSSHEDRLKAVAYVPPRLSNRPKTSAGGGSRSASRHMIPAPEAGSLPVATATANPRRELSPAASRTSAETSSTTSTLRLVGRGGSGSKYRVVAPKPPTLDINNLPKGVSGVASAPPPPPEVPSFHRPTGRGGVGARKKSLDAPPAILSKLPLKRVLSTKFRKDPSSRTSVKSADSIRDYPTSPPISGLRPHYRTNRSTGSLATFNTNSDGISCSPRIPEYPDGDDDFMDAYLPPLSPSSSTFEATFILADPPGCSTPANGSKGNFVKLAKMLGELPPHEIYEHLYRQQHLMHVMPPTQDEPSQDDNLKAAIKASRRSSISASITSFFSPVRARGSGASQHTFSTADGMHPGSLADDASDSWGQSSITGGVDDYDAQASLYRRTLESPIFFAPPSPTLVPPRKATQAPANSLSTGTSANDPITVPDSPTPKPIPSLQVDTSSLDPIDSECGSSPSPSPTTPVPTLHRTKSHSHANRTIVRASRSASLSLGTDALKALHHANAKAKDPDHDSQLDGSRPLTPFSTLSTTHNDPGQRLPELSHWLSHAEMSARAGTPFGTLRSESPATMQTWSGEWNTDMQDVIRALRLLR
ncbi:hypothetical protein CVT24_008880 [Panaeolus cyanescens]|uniref:Uncharacterized protein n=1 Tax=Panaeolus cyanescens TaxID=181874 RepID=A0A409VES4_9AGAR|nr:hypothetical protein CVT24_008880 [Panaeolus cyanescens]